MNDPTVESKNWPELGNAPIVEGLVDIRIERPATLKLDQLVALCDELAEEFPSRQERRLWMGQVTLSPAESTSISTKLDEPDGLILRSTDEKWVAQLRLDGFTFSRLHPYSSWEELSQRAISLWKRYCEIVQSPKVIRVACRFINRITMPAGESFEKTFATTFTIAPSLPQAVAGYLLRVVVPFESPSAVAIITQSMEVNSRDCIFDIDVFSEHSGGLNPNEIWSTMAALRDLKNRLFFESLSPVALERFQ